MGFLQRVQGLRGILSVAGGKMVGEEFVGMGREMCRKGHYARECPNPPKCSHCGKSGHCQGLLDEDPIKKPSGTPKEKPKATAKPASAPKGKGKGGRGKVKGRGSLREVEEGEELPEQQQEFVGGDRRS